MNTRLIDINQWTSTSNISSTKPQEKALYQTVTNLTVHPGASYPLFSVSRGLREHSLVQIAILGVLNGLPSKHFYA